jgi:hypothetical protein
MKYHCTFYDDDFIVVKSSGDDDVAFCLTVGDEECGIVLTKSDAVAFAREILELCGESE